MIPSINHLVGQPQVVARLRVALEHCWTDSVRFPHAVITGPPGTGKTSIGNLIGRELGVQVHERLAQAVNGIAALRGALLACKEKEILFLDEAHQLNPEVQVLLYRAMEGNLLSVRNRDNSTLNLPLAHFTILLATTDQYRLLEPLRDRAQLLLPLSHYDGAALTTITMQRARMMGVELDAEIASGIAARAKQTPRLAIRLLQSCYRYARSQGENQISREHFEQTLRIESLDSLGLDSDEQRYLRLLAKSQGEHVRLFTLESALGIHRRTIQSVIEPFMVRSGLIERHPQGRAITESGLRHLGLIHDPKVSVA